MAKRGRPVKLTLEKVQVLVEEHQKGRTYLALCKERHISYASLNAALKRYGLTDKQMKIQTSAYTPSTPALVA